MAANLVAGTGLHSVRVFFSRQIPSVLPTSHLLPYPNSPNICFEQSAYSLLPERYLFRGLKTWQKLGYTFTGKEKKKKTSKKPCYGLLIHQKSMVLIGKKKFFLALYFRTSLNSLGSSFHTGSHYRWKFWGSQN